MFLAFGKWDECKDNTGVAIPGERCWGLESINNPIFWRECLLKTGKETDHGEKTDCENGRLANNTVIMLACGITIDWKTPTIPFYHYFL